MDREIVEEVEPNSIASYLRLYGFERVISGEYTSLWRGQELDITAPSRRDISDYSGVVRDVIRALSLFQKRPEHDVLRDLSLVAYDIIELPDISGIDALSYAPMKTITAAVECLAQLLLGVAYSTYTKFKTANVPSKRPPQVKDLMNSMKFGVIKNGHASLAAFAPIPLVSQNFMSELKETISEAPFERSVMLQIPRAIRAATDAIAKTAKSGNFARFDDAAGEGASVPVLKALQGMATIQRTNSNLVMLYSPLLGNIELRDEFRVAPDSAREILSDAIRHHQRKDPPAVTHIEGSVIKLGRNYSDDLGLVIMAADIDGKIQKIQMRLLEKDYEIAVRAHEARLRARVSGHLDYEKKQIWLINGKNFTIIDELI